MPILARTRTAVLRAAKSPSAAPARSSVIVPCRCFQSSSSSNSSPATSQSTFVARPTFAVSEDIIRPYYLGHHASALKEMDKMLSNINLVIECRDARIPLTSRNRKFDNAFHGRERIIVFTKCDLLSQSGSFKGVPERLKVLRDFYAHPETFEARRAVEHDDDTAAAEEDDNVAADQGAEATGRSSGTRSSSSRRREAAAAGPMTTNVIFNSHQRNISSTIIKLLEKRAASHDSLLGVRVLIVGMPNAGKSTLLNSLRLAGVGSKKAARTGAEPGVTVKIQPPVKVTEPTADIPAVLVYDTPGVFIPHIDQVEDMLKFALVGCVKDNVVPMEIVADYLLFQLNLRDPSVYAKWSEPTNSIHEFLDSIGRRRGMLGPGGEPIHERAADWIVKQWRTGKLGWFVLDDISEQGVRRWAQAFTEPGPVSLTQARKIQKEQRKAHRAERYATATA